MESSISKEGNNLIFIVKVILFFAAVLMMRPTGLGQEFTSTAMVLAAVSLYLHLIEMSVTKEIRINRTVAVIGVLSLIFWVYILVQAHFVGVNDFDIVIKACLSNVVIIIVGVLLMSNIRANQLIFKMLIWLLLLISVSFAITYSLSFFVSYESLYLFQLPIKGYENAGYTYFPFTVIGTFMHIGSVSLPRMTGIFREPGILQAFLIWAYFSLPYYGFIKKRYKFILLCGLFGTFSTTAIVIFFTCLTFKFILDKRGIKAILLVPSTALALFYTPYIGIKDKMMTHGESITDRSFSTSEGLHRLAENPIGTGLYNSDLSIGGVNFIAASHQIGIIGLVLILLVYFVPIRFHENKKAYLLAISPIFLTALTSQPLLDAPLIYIMLMAYYKKNQEPVIIKLKVPKKVKSNLPIVKNFNPKVYNRGF